MKLVPEHKKILKKAWSIRLAALSGVFGGVEAFLPVFSDSVPHGVFALLTVAASIAVVVSRVVMQEELRNGNE